MPTVIDRRNDFCDSRSVSMQYQFVIVTFVGGLFAGAGAYRNTELELAIRD